MQTLRVYSLHLLAQRTVHMTTDFGWSLRTIATIGCAMFFAVGCARTASVSSSLASSSHASFGTHRSNKNARKDERLGTTRIVTASWYGPGYAGKRTASGE